MQDQLPMLTEKELCELLVSISCELSFRADVREQNEEIQLEYQANGHFPLNLWLRCCTVLDPKELVVVMVLEVLVDGGAQVARDAEEEDFVEEENEYRIPPGEGDRYWDEHGVEQFYDWTCLGLVDARLLPMIGIPGGELVILGWNCTCMCLHVIGTIGVGKLGS